MNNRTARNQVERILDYLSELEHKSCWSGTSDRADDLRLAWWTVWFAFYQDSPTPVDSALRKVLGPRYRSYIQTRGTMPAVFCGTDRDELSEVDGRNGSQWMRSVLAYLDWRSGDSWRPMAHRNHPDRRAYTDASLTLRQAFFHAPSRPPAKPVAKATHTVARSRVA
jgi:hypothetical protein